MDYLLPVLSALKTVAVAIPVLCVLIFVHELGHFLLAKFYRVGVITFSIGFGRVIWARRYGETTYSLRLLPLGGYVRMVGDDPREFEAPKLEEKPENILEPIGYDDLNDVQKKMVEDKSRWFLNKSFFPKFMIVLAGPAFNLIFAIVVAIGSIMIFGEAEPVDQPIIGQTMRTMPAAQAGILSGDHVLSIDGKELKSWMDLSETVRKSGGKPMAFVIERKNADAAVENGALTRITLEVTAVPDKSGLVSDEELASGDVYRIGISPAITRHAVSIGDAFSSGFGFVWFITEQTIRGLKGLVTGSISLSNVAGPIGIFKETSSSAEKGIDHLLGFMVFLSVSLAVLNLLPVPVLDGGHIVFFVIELIKGSPVSIRVREIANQVGMALLLLLMVLALGNDITR